MSNTSNENQPKLGSKRSFDIAFLAGSSKLEENPTVTPEKSAFTKYKDSSKKDGEEHGMDQKTATPTSKDEEEVMAMPPFGAVFNAQNSLNMMQFPALRKLLDITGNSYNAFQLEPTFLDFRGYSPKHRRPQMFNYPFELLAMNQIF